ncbi:hypothetical protein MCHI_004005 [Candidatus Magnetoovum chiemensis]|nr:hypothetical protein MCHI_004005 [Candidatus Magnetoovum chiemensis]
MSISEFKEKFNEISGFKDSPLKLAASFGVGVFIGFTPLLGLHTVMAIFIAWAFKLPKVPTLLGAYINNPLTIIPLYMFSLWAGIKLSNIDAVNITINFSNMNVFELFKELGLLFWPFCLGCTVVGAISALGIFIFTYCYCKSNIKPLSIDKQEII